MTRQKFVQMIPVTGEWWVVYVQGFGRSDPIPDQLDDLIFRSRIIAWAIYERWEEDAFGQSDRHGRESLIAAVSLEGTCYNLVPDFIDIVDEDNAQLIGYFTTEDLQQTETIATLKHAAVEKINHERETQKKKEAKAMG